MKLEVIDSYIDDGIDLFAKNRPEYNRLIEDIKCGKINLIVTANFARIARSQKEMIDILELQKKYNFRTIFADSREELIKDRLGINLKDYMENEDNGLDELEDEAYEEEDMEF